MSSTKTASYLISNNTNLNASSSSSSSFAASYNLNQGGGTLSNMMGSGRTLMTPSPLTALHSSYGENMIANTSLINYNNTNHHHYEQSPTHVNGYNKFLSSSSSSFTPHLLYNNGISQVNCNNNTTNTSNTNRNDQHQHCGICGKEPMLNGKTLIGCLHSFCQSCLIQSQTFINHGNSLTSSHSSIITCPICYQETLMPNGGIDALMPHYSNPLLLNDLLDETSLSSPQFMMMNNLHNQDMKLVKNQNLNNINNGYQNFTSSNGLLDFISSSVSSDSNDSVKQKRLAQQQLNNKKLVYEQQQRLIKIENDINKSYSYYVQVLNERRDNLIKEFQAIVQFVHRQNQNRLLMNDANVDTLDAKAVAKGKKSSSEKLNSGEFHDGNSYFNESAKLNADLNGGASENNSNSSNEMQSSINSHLMAIEFVSNYSNIQAAVRNSFGYIR